MCRLLATIAHCHNGHPGINHSHCHRRMIGVVAAAANALAFVVRRLCRSPRGYCCTEPKLSSHTTAVTFRTTFVVVCCHNHFRRCLDRHVCHHTPSPTQVVTAVPVFKVVTVIVVKLSAWPIRLIVVSFRSGPCGVVVYDRRCGVVVVVVANYRRCCVVVIVLVLSSSSFWCCRRCRRCGVIVVAVVVVLVSSSSPLLWCRRRRRCFRRRRRRRCRRMCAVSVAAFRSVPFGYDLCDLVVILLSLLRLLLHV